MARKKPENEKPTRYRQLPVKLTEHELKVRGQELGAAVERQREAEETKKAQAKDAKEIVDECRKETLRLKDIVNSGTETRAVPVRLQVDLDERLIHTIRLDVEPPAIVSSRSMTEEEIASAQQGRLFPADLADADELDEKDE